MFPTLPILKDVEHSQLLIYGLLFIISVLFLNYRILLREKKRLREKQENKDSSFLVDLSETLKRLDERFDAYDKEEHSRCSIIQEQSRINRLHIMACENFLKTRFQFDPIPWLPVRNESEG